MLMIDNLFIIWKSTVLPPLERKNLTKYANQLINNNSASEQLHLLWGNGFSRTTIAKFIAVQTLPILGILSTRAAVFGQ